MGQGGRRDRNKNGMGAQEQPHGQPQVQSYAQVQHTQINQGIAPDRPGHPNYIGHPHSQPGVHSRVPPQGPYVPLVQSILALCPRRRRGHRRHYGRGKPCSDRCANVAWCRGMAKNVCSSIGILFIGLPVLICGILVAVGVIADSNDGKQGLSPVAIALLVIGALLCAFGLFFLLEVCICGICLKKTSDLPIREPEASTAWAVPPPEGIVYRPVIPPSEGIVYRPVIPPSEGIVYRPVVAPMNSSGIQTVTHPTYTGSYPAGSYPAGSYPAGSYPAGSYPSGSYPSGSYPAGSYSEGSYPVGSYKAGSHPAGNYRAVNDPTGNYASNITNPNSHQPVASDTEATTYRGGPGYDPSPNYLPPTASYPPPASPSYPHTVSSPGPRTPSRIINVQQSHQYS